MKVDRRSAPRLRRCLPTLAALVLAAGPLCGAEPTQARPQGPGGPFHGVTISWDRSAQAFRSPSAEQARVLAEELRRLLDPAAEKGGPRPPVEVVTLPDGTVRARVPAHLFSTSVVRVTAAAGLAPVCSDGTAAAVAALGAPPAQPVVEE